MTGFDRREEAFEKKFALEEEHRFQSEAQSLRLLGLWAAGKLGRTGDAAAQYAIGVLAAEIEDGSRDAAVHKLAADLAGLGITDRQIRDKLAEIEAQAKAAAAKA